MRAVHYMHTKIGIWKEMDKTFVDENQLSTWFDGNISSFPSMSDVAGSHRLVRGYLALGDSGWLAHVNLEGARELTSALRATPPRINSARTFPVPSESVTPHGPCPINTTGQHRALSIYQVTCTNQLPPTLPP
jgi:hypothetical protein